MYFKNIYSYLVLANSLGLPATAVPCGFDKNGMPIGIQVYACVLHENKVFTIATAVIGNGSSLSRQTVLGCG